MTNCFFEYLKEQDVECFGNFNTKDGSSIGIGCIAATAVFPKDTVELINTIEYAIDNNIPYKIIGRMTNILATSSFFDGALIFTRRLDSFVIDGTSVNAECGIATSRLLTLAARVDLGGGEALFGIPGSLGGMIYSNAGAFGMEISDVISTVTVYDPVQKRSYDLDKGEMDFSYRHSKLSDTNLILLSARLEFTPSDRVVIRDNFREYIKRRRASQPHNEPSLGSIFKRHSDVPISYLVDKAGLKGVRIGDAEISNKHAGFIVNRGNATANDVLALITLIKNTLHDKYGIRAEEEIEYL